MWTQAKGRLRCDDLEGLILAGGRLEIYGHFVALGQIFKASPATGKACCVIDDKGESIAVRLLHSQLLGNDVNLQHFPCELFTGQNGRG